VNFRDFESFSARSVREPSVPSFHSRMTTQHALIERVSMKVNACLKRSGMCARRSIPGYTGWVMRAPTLERVGVIVCVCAYTRVCECERPRARVCVCVSERETEGERERERDRERERKREREKEREKERERADRDGRKEREIETEREADTDGASLNASRQATNTGPSKRAKQID
jgi:hypothetical protein